MHSQHRYFHHRRGYIYSRFWKLMHRKTSKYSSLVSWSNYDSFDWGYFNDWIQCKLCISIFCTFSKNLSSYDPIFINCCAIFSYCSCLCLFKNLSFRSFHVIRCMSQEIFLMSVCWINKLVSGNKQLKNCKLLLWAGNFVIFL